MAKRKYFVQINAFLPNGNQGPGFNATLEAESYTAALDAFKPIVGQALKDSGLVEVDSGPSPSSSSPAAPG